MLLLLVLFIVQTKKYDQDVQPHRQLATGNHLLISEFLLLTNSIIFSEKECMFKTFNVLFYWLRNKGVDATFLIL